MISIVLPVYNEYIKLEEGLPILITFLNAQAADYELIIVDDGSESGDKIQEISRHYACRYIRNKQNAGKGRAVKRGILAADGDTILFMDGDFPFDLSAINAIVYKLQTAEVVIGDRTLPASRYPDTLSRSRKWGSRILSWIISNLYVKGVRDSQCGIKGFRAAIAKAIFSRATIDSFAFDVEILFIARKNNCHIARVPVHVFPQATTSVKVMKDGLLMLLSLIKISYNNLSGKYRIDE